MVIHTRGIPCNLVRDPQSYLSDRLAPTGTVASCRGTRLDPGRTAARERGQIKSPSVDRRAGHAQPPGDSADAGLFFRGHRNLWFRDLVSNNRETRHKSIKYHGDFAFRLSLYSRSGRHALEWLALGSNRRTPLAHRL